MPDSHGERNAMIRGFIFKIFPAFGFGKIFFRGKFDTE